MTYYSHNNGVDEIEGFDGYDRKEPNKIEIELANDTYLKLHALSEKRKKTISRVIEDILNWSLNNYEMERKIAHDYMNQNAGANRDWVEELR